MKACAAATIALSAGLLLSACSTDDTGSAPAPTTSWGSVRHERAPLRKHFPDLGEPISASWTKGSALDAPSSRDVLPSPSSTVVDAVVEVRPAVARHLRSTLGHSGKTVVDDSTWPDDPDAGGTKTELPSTPEVAPALRSSVPGGPFVAGNSTLGSTYGWDCTVHVDRSKPIVVVRASLPWASSFEG